MFTREILRSTAVDTTPTRESFFSVGNTRLTRCSPSADRSKEAQIIDHAQCFRESSCVRGPKVCTKQAQAPHNSHLHPHVELPTRRSLTSTPRIHLRTSYIATANARSYCTGTRLTLACQVRIMHIPKLHPVSDRDQSLDAAQSEQSDPLSGTFIRLERLPQHRTMSIRSAVTFQ
jgi:hypothetical protein